MGNLDYEDEEGLEKKTILYEIICCSEWTENIDVSWNFFETNVLWMLILHILIGFNCLGFCSVIISFRKCFRSSFLCESFCLPTWKDIITFRSNYLVSNLVINE